MLNVIRDELADLLVGLFMVVIAVCIVVSVVQEIREPDSGTVIGKEYHPSYTTTSGGSPITSTQCTTSGYPPTMSCTTTTTGMSSSTTTHHPECWEIEFESADGAKGDNCVSGRQYERIAVGDHYEK